MHMSHIRGHLWNRNAESPATHNELLIAQVINEMAKHQVCNHCTHYYITHDANFRYGCHALDFKSRRQPIIEVIDASGEKCHYFQLKRPDQDSKT